MTVSSETEGERLPRPRTAEGHQKKGGRAPQALEGVWPAATLIVPLWPPEVQDNKHLLSKLPGLGFSATGAPGDLRRH